ncbi:hypothetical protein [Labrenzia sp. THAF82]|nr:hypothetical protein [Labrenzia sp. THAF82]
MGEVSIFGEALAIEEATVTRAKMEMNSLLNMEPIPFKRDDS